MDEMENRLVRLPGALLPWYRENRRVLPWREEVSAYRTWVSEIMLQQTRVAAVIPYFQRFMAAYPTVEDLAACDEGELMRLWAGLGYYSRARNLRRAAQVIAEEYGGAFPRTYQELMALPGVGDYTAGAILSIAFGEPVPAVDGNVLRVAARVGGCELDILDLRNRRQFRRRMEAVMPRQEPGAFNQALMDLGAGICLPGGAPLCNTCPAADFCAAREQGRQRELPVRAPKKEKRLEEKTVFLLLGPEGTALRQRPDTGLLAGLWEYPHVPGRLTEEQAARQLRQWGLTPRAWLRQLDARHIFTHIRWEMTGYLVQVEGRGPADWLWADGARRQRLAIPSAFDQFTRALPAEGD